MNMGITIARSFDDAQRNSEKPIACLLGAGTVPQIKYWKKGGGEEETIYAYAAVF